jgi:2-polyprenyl-3-methyl-5-hydroxy-6-metoxy-1,4-benzoquinol methylase
MQARISGDGSFPKVNRNITRDPDVAYLDNWRKDFLEVMFRAISISESSEPKKQLLEVGCGEGQWIIEAAKRGTISTGIDISLRTIARARDWSKRILGDAYDNICFILADAQHLPFKSASFDKIVSMQVIEHVRNDALMVSEISRIGKQNCTTFISTMNTIWRIPPLLWPMFQLHEIRAGHLRGYKHEDLIASFVRRGFLSNEVMYYTHTLKLFQDLYCARFESLRRSNVPLWRKLTKLDLHFGRLPTGWTFSLHLTRKSNQSGSDPSFNGR